MALSQLRHSYSDFKARNAELVEVGPNTPASAALGFRQYLGGRDLEFPYLCDPDWTVHRQYGLRPVGASAALKAQAESVLVMAISRPFVTPHPVDTARLVVTAMEQGLFVLDEAGLVRYAYVTAPSGHLPPAATLLGVLDGL